MTTSVDRQPSYLSSEDAAAAMGISVELVRKLCDEGVLIGAEQDHETGPWRIPVESVEKWQGWYRGPDHGERIARRWWQLDPIWWSLGTLILLIVFIAYAIRIWYRWGRPDPDFLAFSGNVVTILAIVSLLGLETKWGGRLAKAFWTRLLQSKAWLQDVRTGFVLFLLLAGTTLLGFHEGLPRLAEHYSSEGLKAQDKGQYSVAARAFQLAVSLAPEQAIYYFNAGSAYERLGNAAQAIAEYQQALDLDDCLWPAYSELGRLYLLDRESPDAALTILLAGLDRTEQSCSQAVPNAEDRQLAEAVLRKNIGWAYLEKGLPRTALDELQRSDEIFIDYDRNVLPGSVYIYRAEVYRLRALAYEMLEDGEAARRSWQDSENLARAVVGSETCQQASSLTNVFCLDAQIWASEARERTEE